MLDQQKIISTLNWFYSLELSQVSLYNMQSKKVDDIYLKKVLQRVAEIESGHVKNIGEKIRELGGKPTFMGEVVAPLTGKIAGYMTAWPGVVTVLKADIKLEEKAMKDYRSFILKAVGDESLFELLWGNLVDEDLHTSWFASKVKEMETVKVKVVSGK